MPMIQTDFDTGSIRTGVDERLRELLQLHLHPEHGSKYWLSREQDLGMDIRDRIRAVEDLWQLGPTPLSDLRRNSVFDFIPQTFHRKRERFITGETAGTSGVPCATAYRDDEFETAFIEPFLKVAEVCQFPSEQSWLWIGPSGPHIIGKVVRELARRMGSIDPFSVDFDPRWAKKLPDGSFARTRYLSHVTNQAVEVMGREAIGVLFTTPPTLAALSAGMTNSQREAIAGIHYGGMTLSPELINTFRELFPNAVHLAGYGNTLFGVVMEVADGHRMAMDYFPLNNRVIFEVIDGTENQLNEVAPCLGYNQRGRLLFHRFDESALLINVIERDEVERIPQSAAAQALGGNASGLRDPRPPAELAGKLNHGLY